MKKERVQIITFQTKLTTKTIDIQAPYACNVVTKCLILENKTTE